MGRRGCSGQPGIPTGASVQPGQSGLRRCRMRYQKGSYLDARTDGAWREPAPG
ncbi:MAG: hypothetical protein ACLTSZ_09030 [Lachnospiraceae bacterium]